MKNWSEGIEKTTQDFIESFGGLNESQLNWKPNPQTWSIAQNIDHLLVINKTYFTIIESIRKGTHKTPFISKLGFMVSFFGKRVLEAVQSDRKKKTKTFPIWEPSSGQILKGILERFKKHQSELKKRIENSRDLVEREIIISSPANKNIVYKLETAFDIIVTHEKRHYEQSRVVLQLMKKEVIN
jgi:hypothetical protein